VGLVAKAEIIYTLGMIPKAPRLEMACLIIRVIKFRVIAVIKLLSLKIKITTRKIVLRGKYLNTLP
jgi:hypothetical protein